jgi:hypothetical protein
MSKFLFEETPEPADLIQTLKVRVSYILGFFKSIQQIRNIQNLNN